MPAQMTFVDVSNDPAAEERLTRAPELSEALYELGFRRVGLLEGRMNTSGWEEPLRLSLDPEDAEMMIERIRAGEVCEIAAPASASGMAVPAFGVIEWFFGAIVTFETILDNGVVVETTMKPARAPRPRGLAAAATAVGKAGEKLTDPITRFTMNLMMGKPPEWSHPNCPNAGYYVELVDTRDTRALWQRHQERVSEIRERCHTTTRAHNRLAIYRAIHRRFQDTLEFKGRWFPWILMGITVAIVFLAMIPLRTTGEMLLHPTGLITLLLRFALILALSVVVVVLLARFMMPHLPVPLTPLDELVEKEREG